MSKLSHNRLGLYVVVVVMAVLLGIVAMTAIPNVPIRKDIVHITFIDGSTRHEVLAIIPGMFDLRGRDGAIHIPNQQGNRVSFPATSMIKVVAEESRTIGEWRNSTNRYVAWYGDANEPYDPDSWVPYADSLD